MRKYCASSLSFGAYPLVTAFEGIQQAGFDAVEIVNVGEHGEQLMAAEQNPDHLKSLLQKYHLECRSILGATSGPSSDDNAKQIIRMMDIACSLGVSTITLASGGKEESTESEIQQVIQGFQHLIPEAEKRNIIFDLYAHAGSIAYNIERTQRLLAVANSPNFGFYYSPYHFALAGDSPLVALDTFKERLDYVYFNCGPEARTNKGRPLLVDQINYQRVGQCINEIGYDGHIMIILLGGQPEGLEDIVRGLVEAKSEVMGYLEVE